MFSRRRSSSAGTAGLSSAPKRAFRSSPSFTVKKTEEERSSSSSEDEDESKQVGSPAKVITAKHLANWEDSANETSSGTELTENEASGNELTDVDLDETHDQLANQLEDSFMQKHQKLPAPRASLSTRVLRRLSTRSQSPKTRPKANSDPWKPPPPPKTKAPASAKLQAPPPEAIPEPTTPPPWTSPKQEPAKRRSTLGVLNKRRVSRMSSAEILGLPRGELQRLDKSPHLVGAQKHMVTELLKTTPKKQATPEELKKLEELERIAKLTTNDLRKMKHTQLLDLLENHERDLGPEQLRVVSQIIDDLIEANRSSSSDQEANPHTTWAPPVSEFTSPSTPSNTNKQVRFSDHEPTSTPPPPPLQDIEKKKLPPQAAATNKKDEQHSAAGALFIQATTEDEDDGTSDNDAPPEEQETDDDASFSHQPSADNQTTQKQNEVVTFTPTTPNNSLSAASTLEERDDSSTKNIEAPPPLVVADDDELLEQEEPQDNTSGEKIEAPPPLVVADDDELLEQEEAQDNTPGEEIEAQPPLVVAAADGDGFLEQEEAQDNTPGEEMKASSPVADDDENDCTQEEKEDKPTPKRSVDTPMAAPLQDDAFVEPEEKCDTERSPVVAADEQGLSVSSSTIESIFIEEDHLSVQSFTTPPASMKNDSVKPADEVSASSPTIESVSTVCNISLHSYGTPTSYVDDKEEVATPEPAVAVLDKNRQCAKPSISPAPPCSARSKAKEAHETSISLSYSTESTSLAVLKQPAAAATTVTKVRARAVQDTPILTESVITKPPSANERIALSQSYTRPEPVGIQKQEETAVKDEVSSMKLTPKPTASKRSEQATRPETKMHNAHGRSPVGTTLSSIQFSSPAIKNEQVSAATKAVSLDSTIQGKQVSRDEMLDYEVETRYAKALERERSAMSRALETSLTEVSKQCRTQFVEMQRGYEDKLARESRRNDDEVREKARLIQELSASLRSKSKECDLLREELARASSPRRVDGSDTLNMRIAALEIELRRKEAEFEQSLALARKETESSVRRELTAAYETKESQLRTEYEGRALEQRTIFDSAMKRAIDDTKRSVQSEERARYETESRRKAEHYKVRLDETRRQVEERFNAKLSELKVKHERTLVETQASIDQRVRDAVANAEKDRQAQIDAVVADLESRHTTRLSVLVKQLCEEKDRQASEQLSIALARNNQEHARKRETLASDVASKMDRQRQRSEHAYSLAAQRYNDMRATLELASTLVAKNNDLAVVAPNHILTATNNRKPSNNYNSYRSTGDTYSLPRSPPAMTSQRSSFAKQG